MQGPPQKENPVPDAKLMTRTANAIRRLAADGGQKANAGRPGFRQPMLFLGMNRLGASAPNEALAEHFGFTGPAVATKARAWLPTAGTGTR
jgi:transketolase